MPMHEVVRSNLQTKLPRSLRLPSLAGTGLPERMRSTAFAFLGLTAALGLALVAVFAQLNFPLLSPVPLPREAPAGGHVAAGVALGDGPSRPVEALQGGIPAPAADPPETRRGVQRPASEGGGEAEVGGTAPVPVPSGDGVAAETPESPAPAPSSDASTGAGAEPASPPAAEPAEPTPVKSGAAEPRPSKSAAKAENAEARAAKAEAKAAAKTEKTEAKAAAKAEKAASKAPEAEPDPAPASPSPAAPAPETAPGNGKGRALGHDK
ncbi:MAG TPA: hypothetical protein VF170_03235 [Planctomycetaceae bacterium]